MNLRGSEIGMCHQYLAIKALGLLLEQPPPYLQKIFDAGHEQEDEAIAWLEKDYAPVVEVVDRQREVVYKVGEHTITGHIDGIMVGESKILAALGAPASLAGPSRKLLEVKSMSQERFGALEACNLEPAIAMQVAAYCLALLQEGKEIEGFTVLGKLWEKDKYTQYVLDDDDFHSWLEVMREKVEKVVEQVAELVESISVRANEPGSDIQKAVAKLGSPLSTTCRECFARYHCYPHLLKEEKKMAEDFVTSNETADVSALRTYRQGKELEAEGKKLIEAAKAQFERVLDETHPRKLVVEGAGTVSRVTSVRKKWDYEKIRELLGEEKFVECYEDTGSTSLRIALQKEE